MSYQISGGVQPKHVWVITSYDPTNWIFKPVMCDHVSFRENGTSLRSCYMVPFKGMNLNSVPVDRLATLVLLVKQRSVMATDKFYLIECEVPSDFIGNGDTVLLPYIAREWIRSLNVLEKRAGSGDYFNYSTRVLYENEYKSLLNGISSLEFDSNNLQFAIDQVSQLRDPQMTNNYEVTNLDLLNSILVKCAEFEGTQHYNLLADYLRSDIQTGEFIFFRGKNVVAPRGVELRSFKYLWEMYMGREVQQQQNYNVDFNNLPEQIRNANSVLSEQRRRQEKEKEKERIRKEKEEIARRRRYYGRNADRVDDRIRQREDSPGWWARWVANKVTFGLVRPPKTLRSDDYRENFIDRNPGIFVNGLYFCMYCGKPIRAKSENPNWKMYVDHIRPINQGGRNSTWNLGPACKKCNLAKSDKGGEWILRGYLGKVGFTTLQTVSNVSKLALFGYKEKPLWKKCVSVGFYAYTGIWVLRLFGIF